MGMTLLEAQILISGERVIEKKPIWKFWRKRRVSWPHDLSANILKTYEEEQKFIDVAMLMRLKGNQIRYSIEDTGWTT